MSGIRTYHQTDLRVPPTESNHLVRQKDMIEYVAGLTKQPVRVALTAPFVGAYNATAMTLTQATPGELVVDGVTLALNDRKLVTAQPDLTQNGIYIVTTLGDTTTAAVLTRAEDFNSSVDIINGIIVPVSEGDSYGGSRWKLTAATIPAELDVTNLIFTEEIVDFTKVVEMTFPIVGDDTKELFEFEHNLGSLNVTHEIRDDATGETIVALFRRTSINDVEVEFGIPLAAGDNFTLIIRAEVDPA